MAKCCKCFSALSGFLVYLPGSIRSNYLHTVSFLLLATVLGETLLISLLFCFLGFKDLSTSFFVWTLYFLI